MASWESGARYQFKVCQGQVIGKRTPNTKTPLVEVVCEVAQQGPMFGRRVRYTGYLNSIENKARTRTDLQNMGWRGKQWGDWSGLGSGVVFEATVFLDERDGGTFPRLAFPRPLTRVSTEHAIDNFDDLNDDFDKLDDVAAKQREDAIPIRE